MDLTLFAQTAGAVPVELGAAETSFSLIGLFWQADIVVKLVMIGLMVASIWSWAIIIEKLFLLVRIERRTNRFEDQFWSGRSLEDLYASMAQDNNRSSAALFVSAMREWKRSQESMMRAGFIGVQQRIERAMDVEMQKEMAGLESRLLFLATVGSTAPFVGLFGTVWGIMNSFRAIAASKSTNLAVVAPGIAEALFATALGLLAAIPAVIFYNKITNDISKLAVRLESFSGEFSSIISRQLDESV